MQKNKTTLFSHKGHTLLFLRTCLRWRVTSSCDIIYRMPVLLSRDTLRATQHAPLASERKLPTILRTRTAQATGPQTRRIAQTTVWWRRVSGGGWAITGLESSNWEAPGAHRRAGREYATDACGYLRSLHRPRGRVAGAVCSPGQPGHPSLEGWGRLSPLVGRGGLLGSPVLLWAFGHLVRAGAEGWHRRGPCGEQEGTVTSACTAREDASVAPF